PAPGQGALAVEGLAEREDLRDLLWGLNDHTSGAELACERAFSARLEGGCSVPLGCLARAARGSLIVTGYLGSDAAERGLRDRISGPLDSAADIGRELAEAILAAGGDEIIEELRAAEPSLPSPP
ncbi:MAG: hydroxymethylbilane synthase, partial [Actinomycetota bacterium]|nr:hydroxymethylbilane synthase [Actinomycetota bacterium]